MNDEARPFGEHVDILDQSVRELYLSVRTANCLTRKVEWIDGEWHHSPRDMRIRDLIAMSGQELMREPNFGRVCLKDVREALLKHGLYLSGEGPPPPPARSPSPGETVAPVFSPLTLSHRLQVIEAKLDLILSKLVPP